ncbi:MAG: hypothetical protein WCS70_13710, partial [Verrucomicrobiota bacterium]
MIRAFRDTTNNELRCPVLGAACLLPVGDRGFQSWRDYEENNYFVDRGARDRIVCDLLSASVRGILLVLWIHDAGGRSNFVARPPVIMPSISLVQ